LKILWFLNKNHRECIGRALEWI